MYNRIILAGRLANEPEMKQVSSGHVVATFTVAVNRKYKKEEADFIRCEAWGKTAENIEKYFSKGKPIIVEGALKIDSWKDGENYKTAASVNVDNFSFVSGAGDVKTNDEPKTEHKTTPKPDPIYQTLGDEDDLPF